MKKVGIINSGGDCPGLNRVIDAVVRELDRDYELFGFIKGFEGLLENDYMVLDRDFTGQRRWMGGTFLKSTTKGHFPGKVTGGMAPVDMDVIHKAKKNYDALELEGLIVLGGDGSLAIADNLQQFGFRCVGIPKSIDNDLSETDYTFGFFSAVEKATEAIDNLHFTTTSHDRIMVVELMGRDSGWITLYSGIAGGANIILIPEIPCSFEGVLKFLHKRYDSGKRSAVITIAEGVQPKDFMQVESEIGTSSPQKTLGGISGHLATYINANSDFEARNLQLGYLQRGGLPSAYDRILSMELGAYAARLFRDEKFGYMAAFQGNKIVSVQISDAVKTLKSVDTSSQMIDFAKTSGVYFGE